MGSGCGWFFTVIASDTKAHKIIVKKYKNNLWDILDGEDVGLIWWSCAQILAKKWPLVVLNNNNHKTFIILCLSVCHLPTSTALWYPDLTVDETFYPDTLPSEKSLSFKIISSDDRFVGS